MPASSRACANAGTTWRTSGEAGDQGRLAYGYIEAMFGDDEAGEVSLRDASRETGLEPALIERFWSSIGLPAS